MYIYCVAIPTIVLLNIKTFLSKECVQMGLILIVFKSNRLHKYEVYETRVIFLVEYSYYIGT